MWFVYTLITTLAWGGADLLYKLGADEKDRYSHLKTSIAVGIIMGIHAIITLLSSDIQYDFTNILIYLPVSAMYILSMTVGYLGLKYLELSISSPIQNASGAVVCILCLIFLRQPLDALSAVAVVLICAGVILLGVLEKHEQSSISEENERKYRIGFAAFFIPIIYCVLDSLGTFFDAWYLDDFTSTPLRGVNEETFEEVANISYELTFLFVAVILFIFVFFVKKEKLFSGRKANTLSRFSAAILETAGQLSYVYAMSGNGVVAAPMIASYCIVSVILSRILLREKLSAKKYPAIAATILGIILMGIAEGMA